MKSRSPASSRWTRCSPAARERVLAGTTARCHRRRRPSRTPRCREGRRSPPPRPWPADRPAAAPPGGPGRSGPDPWPHRADPPAGRPARPGRASPRRRRPPPVRPPRCPARATHDQATRPSAGTRATPGGSGPTGGERAEQETSRQAGQPGGHRPRSGPPRARRAAGGGRWPTGNVPGGGRWPGSGVRRRSGTRQYRCPEDGDPHGDDDHRDGAGHGSQGQRPSRARRRQGRARRTRPRRSPGAAPVPRPPRLARRHATEPGRGHQGDCQHAPSAAGPGASDGSSTGGETGTEGLLLIRPPPPAPRGAVRPGVVRRRWPW